MGNVEYFHLLGFFLQRRQTIQSEENLRSSIISTQRKQIEKRKFNEEKTFSFDLIPHCQWTNISLQQFLLV